MKKIIKLLFIGLSTLLLCGCTSKDSMEDITIYTSIYPIEYITKALYGEHANIVSTIAKGAVPASTAPFFFYAIGAL